MSEQLEAAAEESKPSPEAAAEESTPSPDDAPEETEAAAGGMSLLEHLGELRKRLTKCAYAVAIGFFACYAFAEDIFDILLQPMVGLLTDSHFQYTSPPEAFFTYMKVAFVAGIFVASPYIFYQLWAFIAPGLYEHERKWIIPISVFTALLFVTGALFGYFVVFPFGFEFFASYSNEKIQFIPKLNEYTTFCLQLLLAFGLIFELPLFMLILARLGVVTADKLRKTRKYAILVIFIVAAILTPPDPFTQTLMAGPLLVLYELSIWLAKVFGKKPAPPVEEDEDEEAPAEAAVPAAPETPAVEAAAPAALAEGGESPAADAEAPSDAPAKDEGESGGDSGGETGEKPEA
ncbi:MAG TPA: twin-arginine translocase subunit TatC [Desulfovibrio sp.]|nr:twin-arginine translocase subunit TatC [Desulfovibrio sp.]